MVPKEIKMLLKKAGFKKKDLKKKETALAIYEILLKEIEIDSSNPQNLIGGFKGGVRTSSDLNSNRFITNRLSNEDSRMNNERTNSAMNFGLTTQNNFGMISNTLQNQDLTDGKLKAPISGGIINSANRISNLNRSPFQSPDTKEE